MVKNIPTIERSTKIRFGKNVPDSQSQEENTIVFNASNVDVSTPYSNAVYLSPIRNRTDYQAPEVVLLMYDRNTKEITESGESANVLVGGSTFDAVVNRNNATSNTVQFVGPLNDVSFVASSNVGLSNLDPKHTVSVGSNLYIDDLGSNVLVVSGNVAILDSLVVDGNLRVNGDTTVIYTENTAIRDAFVELGANNTSGDTTLDLGILMHRPDALSNVVIGYREGTDEFALAYTDAKPTDKTFTPKTDEDINVHVYGLTHVDANIYAHEDVLVDGNTYVSGNVSITEELTISNNVYADKDLEVIGNVYVDGNVVAYKDFTLTGNAYVSGNVNVTKQLSVSGNAYVSGNVQVTEALIVSGNTHLEGDNVFITHTMDFLDPTTAIVTDQVSNVQIRLGQLENVANTVSNPSEDHLIVYDGTQWVNDYPMHTYVKIRNDEDTATIEKGDAVYVKGTHNSNILNVGLAQSDSATTMPCIGLSNQQLTTGEQGTAIAYGKALSIVTTGFIAGETIYVSNTVPGGLSNVKPYNNDLIQNVGVVTKVHSSNGGVFVTGIGRANDIPNAELITDYNEMNYVYVNDTNNDLKKITSANLNIPLTTAVSSSSNSAANAVTLRGVSITSGDGFHGDLVVAGNVTVDSTTLHVDAETDRLGLGTITPKATLDIVGNVHVTSNISTASNVLITGDAATTSKTTGALQVTGGVGIQGDLHATHANLEDVEADSITVTDTTHSTSKDTGAVIVTQGGLGVEANIHSTNVFAASHIGVGTSATSNTFDVRGTANVGALVTTSTHISDSTASTSKTSGALQVTGGAGIQGELHAADTTLDSVKPLNMSTNTLPITDGSKKLINSFVTQDNGSLIINANVEITGNISVVGNTFQVTSNDLVITDRIITLANNNTEHDLDIGIIMEHPNYNIGIIHHGSTHIGGAPGHHLSVGYINEGPDADSVTWKDDAHITANVWGHLITQNTVTVEYGNVYIVDGGLGIGIGDGENDNVPDSKLYVTGNAHVTSNITTASNVLITGDAAASSKTTGALQVTGGVGIQGDIHATHANLDGVTITDATTSTDQNSGALIVQNGGVGIEENLNVGGVTKVWDTTDATTTTSGALQVVGGLGVAKSVHAVTFKGTTLTGTNLYGTLSGSNTAAVSDMTASGTVKGVSLTGTNLYGTLSGSNTAAVSDMTASGTVKGASLTGTNLYGTLSGSNTAAVSDMTASGTVKGVSLTGTNLYGTLSGSNTAAVSDMTASGTVKGASLTGTNLYGTLSGSNTASVTTLTASGTTEATDTLTGALTVAGGLSTQTNVHASNVYVHGGLITNRGGTCKKTYSHTGTLPDNATIAQSTFTVVFSAHVFAAKIYATIVEGTSTVSSLVFDCCGGHITGGVGADITIGQTTVIGHSACPWSTVVTSDATTVTFKSAEDVVGSGYYNIFVEYLSAHADGVVDKFTEGGVDEITFNY
jgi:cytoskeletal protein CcmA (bactofilin family)